MSTLSILVVEDDSNLRMLIETILAGAGYQIVTTHDAQEATRLLAEARFDVVVTDMLLGDSDGTEVIQAARAHQPSVQIVAMSGGGHMLTADYCLGLAGAFGACVSLVKPFTPEQLIAAVKPAEAAARKATILLIEDEEVMRATIAGALRFAGHTVIEASRGEEGLRRHSEGLGEFDLVICDLILPGTGGVELIRRLRRRTPSLPILAISGATHALKWLESTRGEGPQAELAKPFTPTQLLAAVTGLLESAKHRP